MSKANYGVVLLATGNGSGSYTDVDGSTVAAGQLTNAVQVAGATKNLGLAGRVLLRCKVTFANGASPKIRLRLRARVVDPNFATDPGSGLPLLRHGDGTTATYHDFDPAAGTTQFETFGSSQHLLLDEHEVTAEPLGAPAAADSLRVELRAF